MKVLFRLRESKRKLSLLERTYTVGDTQYWKRSGKYYSWSETGGRKEISQDDYFKALAGGEEGPPKVKKDIPKINRKEYPKTSDEDLAILSSSGDEHATDVLIRRYEPLVRKLSNKYFLKGGDQDDLVQSGLLGMWDAIKTYDSDKNPNFSKYISIAIDRRLKSAVRSDDTQKNQFMNTASSMDDAPTNDEGEGRSGHETIASTDPTPEKEYLDKERTNKLLKFMQDELAPKERDAIFRFINGSSISQIADEMGVSYKSVENAIARARWKIQDYRSKMESKKVRESRRVVFRRIKSKDLDESGFDYNGSHYSCYFGLYKKDSNYISREEYFKAKDLAYDTTDKEGLPDLRIDDMPNMSSGDRCDVFSEMTNKFVDYLNPSVKKPEGDTQDHIVRESGDLEDFNKFQRQRISYLESLGYDRDEAENINIALEIYSGDNKQPKGPDKYSLEKYLDNLPTFYNGKPLYRGMRLTDSKYVESLLTCKEGSQLSLIGFTSFSSDPEVASRFATSFSSKDSYHVMIVNTRNLTGKSIRDVSDFRTENEVLYKQDAKFFIKNKVVAGKCIYLHVEEGDLQEDTVDIVDIGLEGTQHIKE